MEDFEFRVFSPSFLNEVKKLTSFEIKKTFS